VNDTNLIVQAAMDGIGLAFAFEQHVASHLASGALIRVLEDWSPPFPGFFLYYPTKRNHSSAFVALIDEMRDSEHRNSPTLSIPPFGRK
jgi:DNA-binding transcriptional LysR family regulator